MMNYLIEASIKADAKLVLPEHLGAYIDEAKELLKEIGFDSFCTFEKMKPIFHQL